MSKNSKRRIFDKNETKSFLAFEYSLKEWVASEIMQNAPLTRGYSINIEVIIGGEPTPEQIAKYPVEVIRRIEDDKILVILTFD